jgi:hypothetical protein
LKKIWSSKTDCKSNSADMVDFFTYRQYHWNVVFNAKSKVAKLDRKDILKENTQKDVKE